jgi:hypothetical protein
MPAECHDEAQDDEGDRRDHPHDEDDGPVGLGMRELLKGSGRVRRGPRMFVGHDSIVGAPARFAAALAPGRTSV